MKTLLTFSVVLAFCFHSFHFQEPTLSETIKWLEENLPAKAVYSGKKDDVTLSSRITSAKFTGCVCEIKVEEEFSTGGTASGSTQQYNIPLTALDGGKLKLQARPGGFQPPSTLLFLPTKDDAKMIQQRSTKRVLDDVSVSTSLASSIWLTVGDEEMSKRFAKAFTRAIKLCQEKNKKEPF